LVLASSFILARLGIQLSIKELGWMRMRGLVLKLKKVRKRGVCLFVGHEA
jgi:hypothetical protein